MQGRKQLRNEVISQRLLKWYDQVKRDLPWRENKDPYRIWLSEIMLQQTQVVTVIDYFKRFLSVFPDVYALADADEEQVFKCWEGLGYYSRARNLHLCAKKVVEEHGGAFPSCYEALLKLPGIGPYTAGAIASIAFDKKVPAVDGNVLRVISRLFCIDATINKPQNHGIFVEQTTALLPTRVGDFNQALMELGATVCTPKQWKCEVCPISQECCAKQNQRVAAYPVKLKKSPQRIQKVAICIVSSKMAPSKLLVIKHDSSGLLGNLWGFPRYELPAETETIELETFYLWFETQFGEKPKLLKSEKGMSHVFTHIKWQTELLYLELEEAIRIDYPKTEWVNMIELNALALPKAYLKQLELIKKTMTTEDEENEHINPHRST
jgi:A/G-specific adenine glycosylase